LPRHSRTLSLLFSCKLSTVTEAAQLGGITQTTRPNSSASQEQGMRGVEI
jgi:hypothetical protein